LKKSVEHVNFDGDERRARLTDGDADDVMMLYWGRHPINWVQVRTAQSAAISRTHASIPHVRAQLGSGAALRSSFKQVQWLGLARFESVLEILRTTVKSVSEEKRDRLVPSAKGDPNV
jgi:hypothetical protein